ncbi:MAG TPA: DUF979 domain-containing protein [Steroidobacteraceae bacterium]
MITLEHVYILTGAMFAVFAIGRARDRSSPRQWRSAAFWALYALSFLIGSRLPDFANGVLLLTLVILASCGLAEPSQAASLATRKAAATTNGNRLFVPALAIPVVVLVGTLAAQRLSIGGSALFEPAHVTLIALAVAVLVALALGFLLLEVPPSAPLREGRRLMEAVGWAAVLPQILASLGALFAAAGVGAVVGRLVTAAIPMTSGSIAVVTYTFGMALFTVVMGNAFAAFPVMTAAIGLPLIVGRFGGDPVVMASLGMLSGFCGTLMTPMAANFNIVPAALLELPDRNAVIKVQIPTALVLLAANTVLMAVCVFRR